jgi:Ferritin-like
MRRVTPTSFKTRPPICTAYQYQKMSSGTNIPRLTVNKPELEWSELSLPLALKTLKEHLQTAVTVELYTIPLYLFAAYSIKPGGQSNKVVWDILS